MRSLTPAARHYVLAVTLAGAAILVWRLQRLPFQLSLVYIVLFALSAVLGPRTVSLGQKVEMSVSLPLILCGLICVGPGAAIDVAIVGMSSTCLARKKPFPLHRTLFNVASLTIVAFASGRVYTALLPVGAPFTPSVYFVPLAASVATFFFTNTILVGIVISLSSGRPFLQIWQQSFLWTLVSYLAGGSIAVGMVHLLRAFGPYSLALAIPPILLIYYFFRFYIDRANEHQKRMEEIKRHNEMLESEVARRTQALVELNERLQESNQQLKRANRLKSEFLANMSHELRTPLNAIIGFSELLSEEAFGPLGPDQKGFVGDIHSSGKHLLALINDILDLSKIEAGRMVLHREECDFHEIVRETMTVVHPLALKKQLRIESDVEPRLNLVRVDPGKVKQVMYNLLSNAVKFTLDGGLIQIAAKAEGGDLVVAVSDTGIGIPEQDAARIFDQFFQVDGSYTRMHEGTGLGLALVKCIVELHGGNVEVQSAPKQGSTFSFRLPGAVDEHGEDAAAPAGASGGERIATEPAPATARGTILVVEDNPVNMRLTRSILASHGFGVLEAPSGEDALRLIRHRKPDLILMDLQLPGMDGLTLTRLIKTDPATCSIPTVALTACAMKGDEDMARDAGCVGYITKPVSAANLPGQVTAFLMAGV